MKVVNRYDDFLPDMCRGCEYHTPLQFADILRTNRNQELALIDFNTSSLPKNKCKIESLLMQLPTLAEVTAMLENKINSSNKHLVDLENYHFAHVNSLMLMV